MPNFDPRIDEYHAKAAEFAQPILNHIREVVHQACPDVEETIKWGMPHYDYKGASMMGVASFKEHCAVSFHKASLMPDPQQLFTQTGESGMGHLGKIKSVADLPADNILKEYIREAMKVNEAGKKVKKATKAKAEIPVPDYFTEALSNNPQALATFENFPPGAKRDYLDWITEAKTESTREKRLQTAIEWMAEGKKRNWKYEKK